MIAINIEKLSCDLDALERKLHALADAEILVGVKEEQGRHSTFDGSYTDLLWMHHSGYSSNGRYAPARPIKDVALLTYKGNKTALNKGLDAYFSDLKSNKVSVQDALSPIVEHLWGHSYKIFGDYTKLEPNAQGTIDKKGFDAPLFDTGELQSQWSAWINGTKVR